jgi:hypothetical protein
VVQHTVVSTGAILGPPPLDDSPIILIIIPLGTNISGYGTLAIEDSILNTPNGFLLDTRLSTNPSPAGQVLAIEERLNVVVRCLGRNDSAEACCEKQQGNSKGYHRK